MVLELKYPDMEELRDALKLQKLAEANEVGFELAIHENLRVVIIQKSEDEDNILDIIEELTNITEKTANEKFLSMIEECSPNYDWDDETAVNEDFNNWLDSQELELEQLNVYEFKKGL